MAVSDNTVMSIFALAFIYYVIYKRNRFLGSILLFGTGLLVMTNTDLNAGYGFVIFIVTLINMLWEATVIFDFRKNSKDHLH